MLRAVVLAVAAQELILLLVQAVTEQSIQVVVVEAVVKLAAKAVPADQASSSFAILALMLQLVVP
jgi:hypothetical protein